MLNINNIYTKRYNRNLDNFNEHMHKPENSANLSQKEQALQIILENMVHLLIHNNLNAKDIVRKCLNLQSGNVQPANDYDSLIIELGKNKSTLFGTKVFPRGFQKILAICYICDSPTTAFIDKSFNYSGFREWIEGNFGIDVASNLDRKYYANITYDTEQNSVSLGNKEYKNQLNHMLIITFYIKQIVVAQEVDDRMTSELMVQLRDKLNYNNINFKTFDHQIDVDKIIDESNTYRNNANEKVPDIDNGTLFGDKKGVQDLYQHGELDERVINMDKLINNIEEVKKNLDNYLKRDGFDLYQKMLFHAARSELWSCISFTPVDEFYMEYNYIDQNMDLQTGFFGNILKLISTDKLRQNMYFKEWSLEQAKVFLQTKGITFEDTQYEEVRQLFCDLIYTF